MHDRYPVPYLQDFTAQLEGKKIFSKIGLVRRYNQIPVAAVDIPKTAVINPFGLFNFLRMPFGLKNAAKAFQRLMDQVCPGLEMILLYTWTISSLPAMMPNNTFVIYFFFSKDWQKHGRVINVAKLICSGCHWFPRTPSYGAGSSGITRTCVGHSQNSSTVWCKGLEWVLKFGKLLPPIWTSCSHPNGTAT